MFPNFSIAGWLDIYTFGVCITLAWIIFFSLLHRFSIQRGFSKKHIFIEYIVPFTLSMFLFSRLLYILIEWRSEKFIFVDLLQTGNIFGFLKQLFVTDNYSLSFAGGVIGFLIVFFWATRNQKKDRGRYWDAILPAFFIAAMLGYLGTLLGGQLYGKVMDIPVAITYTHPQSIVPLQNPTFPLPIIYIIFSGLVFVFLYRLEQKIKLPQGFVGYMGMGIFSILLFIFEFLNGSSDLFSSTIGINLVQTLALVLIFYSFLGIFRGIKT